MEEIGEFIFEVEQDLTKTKEKLLKCIEGLENCEEVAGDAAAEIDYVLKLLEELKFRLGL